MNETIEQIFKGWAELSYRYSRYGAADTEPDWHFEAIVRDAFLGKPFKALTRQQWEVFQSTPREVVTALNGFARQAHRQTRQLARAKSRRPAVYEQLNQRLWRVDLNGCLSEWP